MAMACNSPTVQVGVVGGGLAGVSACNAVVENGGRTVLIDKSSFCGGNSTTSGINGPATRTQKDKGSEDPSEVSLQDTLKGGKKPEAAKARASQNKREKARRAVQDLLSSPQLGTPKKRQLTDDIDQLTKDLSKADQTPKKRNTVTPILPVDPAENDEKRPLRSPAAAAPSMAWASPTPTSKPEHESPLGQNGAANEDGVVGQYEDPGTTGRRNMWGYTDAEEVEPEPFEDIWAQRLSALRDSQEAEPEPFKDIWEQRFSALRDSQEGDSEAAELLESLQASAILRQKQIAERRDYLLKLKEQQQLMVTAGAMIKCEACDV